MKKSESTIPTAEEFLCQIEDFSLEHCRIVGSIDYLVVKKLKEFAKLHVDAALKSAIMDYPSAYNKGNNVQHSVDAKISILKSYPEKNIK